jgi:hypothetical protein
MQMLVTGGAQALTDDVRKADENNPRGFFELEAVKSGRDYAKWMADARGKVVKIVAPLLHALPEDYSYRVVFCLRPLDQVLSSQRKMSTASSRPAATTICSNWRYSDNYGTPSNCCSTTRYPP